MIKTVDLRNIYKENYPIIESEVLHSTLKKVPKSDMIIKTIKDNLEDYDKLLISVNILNLIENSMFFDYKNMLISDKSTALIGTLLDREVYVDLEMIRFSVKLTYRNQTKRDHKLEAIINSSIIKEDLNIDFIF